jgi:hypothetical protein
MKIRLPAGFARGVIWVGVTATAWGQGSLTPPGAPGPTMKTLAQVEPRTPIPGLPYTITNSGAYYLTTNLTGIADTSGVVVVCDDVAIDLRGFTLYGQSGSHHGVFIQGARQNVAIRNGTIRDWGGCGIQGNDEGNAAQGCQFTDLHLTGNGDWGLSGGDGARVSGCTARGNAGGGLSGRFSSVVRNCAAQGCGIGIHGSNGSTISGCASRDSGTGIDTPEGSTVVDCTALANGVGISAGPNCTIKNCTAKSNGTGIRADAGSTISGCTADMSGDHGIRVTRNCYVLNNTCQGDTNSLAGDGVRVVGAGNRIEANHCTGHEHGIMLEQAGNLVLRNSARGNTVNYDITGTQTIGPVITETGTLTNANPWANFEF